MLSHLGWQIAWTTTLTARTGTDELLRAFTLPQGLIFPTFRLQSVFPPAVGGTASIYLRFGFEDLDATPPGGQGINFAAMTVVRQEDTRSPVWGGTTAVPLAPPDFTGNPFSMLPPRVGVFATTVAFSGQLRLSYAGLIVS